MTERGAKWNQHGSYFCTVKVSAQENSNDPMKKMLRPIFTSSSTLQYKYFRHSRVLFAFGVQTFLNYSYSKEAD